MSRSECVREQDILDAIASGRWPGRLSVDLQAHIESCDVCKDMGLVAQAFRDDRHEALATVRVPSAGLVWWRAELRAKQEAIRVASRPITFVQVLAAVCGLVVVAGLLSRMNLEAVLGVRLLEWLRVIPEHAAPLSIFLLPIGLLLIVAFLAVYFVMADE